jgi:pimeloyl-ACP methyl ester carboxylesterase
MTIKEKTVSIPIGQERIEGTLRVPEMAIGVVLFAHGSGSSRFSTRNRHVASVLEHAGLATLLIDLLTEEEERADRSSGLLRFDIRLLAERVAAATTWLHGEERVTGLALGYFGASTGAAAALVAASERPEPVAAVVSRGGRPDLAGSALAYVRAPTLLIVGGLDAVVLELNRGALAELRGEKRLEIVPGATHLFEEDGALDAVARLASDWFVHHLSAAEEPF